MESTIYTYIPNFLNIMVSTMQGSDIGAGSHIIAASRLPMDPLNKEKLSRWK